MEKPYIVRLSVASKKFNKRPYFEGNKLVYNQGIGIYLASFTLPGSFIMIAKNIKYFEGIVILHF